MTTKPVNLVQEAAHLTKIALNEFNKGEIIDKAVIVIGKTGVGKTTLINMLAGHRFRSVYDVDIGELRVEVEGNQESFKIGHRLISETSVPQRIDINGVAFWDCQGWRDLRGPAQQIANAVSLKKVFEVCKQVKIILGVRAADIDDTRAKSITEFVSDLDELLVGQVERISQSVSLIIPRMNEDKTVQQIRNKIQKVIDTQGLRLEESALELLQAILSNPISLIREFPKVSGPIDTRPIQKEVFSNLDSMKYAQNVEAFVSLPPECKNVVLESYNTLIKDINEEVSRFLQSFKQCIQSFVGPYSYTNITVEEKDRHVFLPILQQVISKLKEAGDLQYSVQAIPLIIDKCLEVALICKNDLETESLSHAKEMVDTMTALEEFVDTRAQIPLQMVDAIRKEISSSLIVLEKAEINITAMDEKDRAQKEEKRRIETEERERHERFERIRAEERASEAERKAREAEQRARNYRSRNPRCALL